ncbi:sensor histidine kinase [Curtobacterium herbarum]|uniref:histidine kinase n=1 Tax=Curtobacterium herbarum TaxID=150122 RepID=A0ABN1ZFA1_9MICO|nr:HAMP domain-containing sensor histidine kinase [Curtobacterium herbarum]MBM7474441.1 two-component system OmpR family sensor kinase [Curtobacterium herbarum]MCS6545826.1 HAMP domain-containing histidine kinase [Curtobacterium herbarum]
MPSLRWRIVAAVALLLVATNVVVGAVTVVAYRGYLVERLDAELATAAGRVVGGPPGGMRGGFPTRASSASGSSSGSSSSGSSSSSPPPSSSGSSSSAAPDPDNTVIGAPGQSAGTVVAIYRDGDALLGGYTDARGRQHTLTAAQERTLAALDPTGQPVTTSLGTLGPFRAQAVGSDGDVFVTALPLGDLDASISRLLLVIAAVTLVGLLVACWAGALLVRRSLRPLEHVAAVASSVTTLDLDRGDPDIAARVADSDLAANREVGQVGTALNRLLGHVARALTVRRDAEAGMRTFVADASHELRTPIATVRAYAELTGHTDDPAEVRRNVDRIGTEARRMGDLVEELLLLARLDAAAVAGVPRADTTDPDDPVPHPSAQPVDLTSIVVEATMDARTTAPGHRWTLQVDDDPVVLDGDAGALRRVVTNLLTNARTHTPTGTAVVVSLRRAADAVQFVVANDGPPIPAEALPTLFDRFTRGAASRSREHGTSGLGLAIVRAVVEAEGGTVHVVSDQARTAFTVTLPLL